MQTKKILPRSICPACKGIIQLERRYKRQALIQCPHCKQILEVVREHPQKLDFPDDPYLTSLGGIHHRFG